MSTAELELEPLETASEVVDAAPRAEAPTSTSTDVALATMKTGALSELSVIDQGIAHLRELHSATDYDVTTTKGMQLAKARRAAFRDVRYRIPHIVKARKEDIKGVIGLLEKEGERIAAELQTSENVHDTLIKAEEARLAEIAEKEKARKAAHQEKLDKIISYKEMAKGKTSEQIQAAIDWLEKMAIDPVAWEEFAVKAAEAKADVLADFARQRDAAKAAELKALDDERIRLENEARTLAMAQMTEVQTLVMNAMGQKSDAVQQALEAVAAHASASSTDQAVQNARTMAEAQLRQMLTMAQHNETMQAQLAALQAPAATPPVQEPAPAPVAPAAPVAAHAHQPMAQADDFDDVNAQAREAVAALDTAAATNVADDAQADVVADPGPLLTTGAVCDRYGFSMTADFIRARGLTPATAPKGKSGTYWPAADMPKLDRALIAHITAVSNQPTA